MKHNNALALLLLGACSAPTTEGHPRRVVAIPSARPVSSAPEPEPLSPREPVTFTILSATEDEERVTVKVAGRYALPPKLRLARNEKVDLSDDLAIIFRNHSHKRTHVDGPPSPLIVHYTLHRAQPSGVPFIGDGSVYIATHRTRLFDIDALTLELVDHEYGNWMDVRVVSTP